MHPPPTKPAKKQFGARRLSQSDQVRTRDHTEGDQVEPHTQRHSDYRDT